MLNGQAADLDRRTREEIALIRRFALSAGWKLIAVFALDFMLLRILGPNLVNLHQDWALAASLACLVLALAATLWLAYGLWIDSRRFAHVRRLTGL